MSLGIFVRMKERVVNHLKRADVWREIEKGKRIVVVRLRQTELKIEEWFVIDKKLREDNRKEVSREKSRWLVERQ